MTLPNIVFLHSHNTGKHIEPYGYAAPTPNLQRMAAQGTVFRRAFAAAPSCSPSRAGFLTGLCPHAAGMLGLAHRGFGRTDYPEHITRRLRAAGYHSVLCGMEHIVPHEAGTTPTAGYDQCLDVDPAAARAGPAVAAFLRQAPKQPFFLSVGLRETHAPFAEPQPRNHPAEDERYCMPPAPLPDVPETRRDTAGFKASARHMDDAWGQILDALDETGLSEDTVVFCFSDHGLQLPMHMCNLTDRGLEVYLIARGPGGFNGGRVVDAMVSLLDLVPTCCDLAGIDADPCHGRSLLPLVRGETDCLHDELFGEQTFHAAYEPLRSVRTERYKYIRRYDDCDRPVSANIDECLTKRWLMQSGWVQQPRDREMLFDLVFDPDERDNLIDRPDMASVRDAMRSRLDEWMRATDDPLLPDGVVAPPPSAKLKDPDEPGAG